MIALFVLMILILPHPDDEPQLPMEYKLKANGEINLVTDAMIRDKFLPRGRYVIQHRIDGDQHLVVVAQVPDRRSAARPTVVVPATTFPIKSAFAKSIVYAEPPPEGQTRDRSYRIVKIDIAGEAVDHLF